MRLADIFRRVDIVEPQAHFLVLFFGVGRVVLVEEFGDAREADDSKIVFDELVPVEQGPAAGENLFRLFEKTAQDRQNILGCFGVDPRLAVALFVDLFADFE